MKHTHRHTQGRADGGASRCQCDGATAMMVVVAAVVWRPPSSPVSTPDPPLFPVLLPPSFFFSRYSARNPGVGFAGPGKYASDKGDPPAVESLSAAITRGSRDDRILPAANLPVLPSLWDPHSIHTGRRRAGKCAADFSIGLSAE